MRSKMSSSCNPLCSWAFSRLEPDLRYHMTSPLPPAACNHWDAIFSQVHLLTQAVSPMHQHPLSPTPLRRGPSPCSWVDQRLVREHWIDHLSHEACALSLFLVTVADAQGLRYDAEASLCHRLSLTSTALHQARQALIQRGLVAYQHPLYQGLALDPDPIEAPKSASPVAADDAPVDRKAVLARLWEALS
jgi:hypothetical protein